MILLKLDRHSKIPLFQQIFQQLKTMIEDQVLTYGYRMPSTRTLAEKHGINRSTVYKAYQELWAMGYIESRPGSYSVVRHRQKLATIVSKNIKKSFDWGIKLPPEIKAVHKFFQTVEQPISSPPPKDLINFASLDIDARLFPAEDFRKALNTAIVAQRGIIFKYGESRGLLALREYIAARLRIHGISVTYDEILITNGSQNSIELVIKTLTQAESEVVIESPTYSHALPLFQFYKNRILEVPMKETGMDLDHLKRILENHMPVFIYTMPNFHNPTGITTDHLHREKILNLAEAFQVPIVEDAFEEEMKYFGKVPLPIKSMDSRNLVIYLGTFSKVFAPGLRIGWIAADKELIERITAIKKFSDLSTNNLIQSALLIFCRQGFYDRHIKRIHREYRKRMLTLISRLRDEFKEFKQISWQEPAGGYLSWIKLKDTGLEDAQIYEIFLKFSVSVSMGSIFYPNKQWPEKRNKVTEQTFRISISTVTTDEIKEGIHRLRGALSQIYKKNTRRK